MDFAIRQAIRDVRRVNAQYKSPEYTRLLHVIANTEAIMLITGPNFFMYQKMARLARHMYPNFNDQQYLELEKNGPGIVSIEVRLFYRRNNMVDTSIDVVMEMPGLEWDPYLVWSMRHNQGLIVGPQWDNFNHQGQPGAPGAPL